MNATRFQRAIEIHTESEPDPIVGHALVAFARSIEAHALRRRIATMEVQLVDRDALIDERDRFASRLEGGVPSAHRDFEEVLDAVRAFNTEGNIPGFGCLVQWRSISEAERVERRVFRVEMESLPPFTTHVRCELCREAFDLRTYERWRVWRSHQINAHPGFMVHGSTRA